MDGGPIVLQLAEAKAESVGKLPDLCCGFVSKIKD